MPLCQKFNHVQFGGDHTITISHIQLFIIYLSAIIVSLIFMHLKPFGSIDQRSLQISLLVFSQKN
jgi:hypothetical protein